MRVFWSAVAILVGAAKLSQAQHLPLPGLLWAYDALEPFIDEATMRVHHLGHMKAYTDKVNAAIGELRAKQDTNALAKNGLEWLLTHLEEVPEPQRSAIANHGGGYVNHELYFSQFAPSFRNDTFPGGGGDFSMIDHSEFKTVFLQRFVSLEVFKELVKATALRLFGSGWVWLEVDFRGAVPVLAVSTTVNQDTPATDPRRKPILGLDVWEHAYCEWHAMEHSWMSRGMN